MVALLLFVGGGVYSIYEGLHKWSDPEPVENVVWALAVLGGSVLLEGAALLSNIREMGRRRGAKPFGRYLRDTKDSDLVVVFGENLAAVAGLVLALGAVLMAWATGDSRWDAAGSLAIGTVLVIVAVFLATEVKSLLIGESADPQLVAAVAAEVAADPRIVGVGHVLTVQQGPGQVVVATRLRFAPTLPAAELMDAIRGFEVRLRRRAPEVRWCFTEPMSADLPAGADPEEKSA